MIYLDHGRLNPAVGCTFLYNLTLEYSFENSNLLKTMATLGPRLQRAIITEPTILCYRISETSRSVNWLLFIEGEITFGSVSFATEMFCQRKILQQMFPIYFYKPASDILDVCGEMYYADCI